jgi:uncharacterized protein YjiS (DUF1127 family)
LNRFKTFASSVIEPVQSFVVVRKGMMTMSEFCKKFPERGARHTIRGMLVAGLRAMRCYRSERQALIALSRLDPRLIRDLGFDPEQVYEALDGTWDEVDPASLRSQLPRKDRV